MCCLVHDICYTEEDKTQEECDVEFCRCLRRTLHEAAEKQGNHTEAKGCDTVATSYCNLGAFF